jgi:hypothetical protein
MNRSPLRWATLFLPVALLAACGSENTALEAGLVPVAPVTDIAWPAPLGGPCPESLVVGTPFSVFGVPSYTEGHGRACVNGTLKQVWAAMQIPSGVQLSFYPERNDSDCEPRLNVETGYDVSFLTKEVPHGAIESHYTFEITWREGVTEGTKDDPRELRVKYGKTFGTTEVPMIKGSMILFEDPPGTVRLEIVRQLNTNGHSDDPGKLVSWITGYYDAVRIALSTTPPGTALPNLCALP